MKPPLFFVFGVAKLLKKIASRIKEAREEKGLTQADMVEYGINYRHHQKIECGKQSIPLHTLYRLSIAFEVNISNLI